jgi:hypothetical protein
MKTQNGAMHHHGSDPVEPFPFALEGAGDRRPEAEEIVSKLKLNGFRHINVKGVKIVFYIKPVIFNL